MKRRISANVKREGGNKANGRGEKGKRMTAGGIAALLLGCLLEADASPSPSLLPVSSSSPLLYPTLPFLLFPLLSFSSKLVGLQFSSRGQSVSQ